MTRLTLDVSTETDEMLSRIAQKKQITKSELMRRAFALLYVANEQEEVGNTLGIIKSSTNELVSRLVGI